MFEAVLFDFDGTLADTLGLYVKAYDTALKKIGVKYTESQIVTECFGKTEEEICQKLSMIEKVGDFRKTYFAAIDEIFNSAQLFPGVKQALETAKLKQIKLGVITFAHRWYLDKMLDLLKIREYFQTQISFTDVKHPKPHPEAVIRGCLDLKTVPATTLVIGDSKSDVLMGKSIKCLTGLFTPKENEKFYDFDSLRLTSADFEFDNFDDIEEFFIFPPRE